MHILQKNVATMNPEICFIFIHIHNDIITIDDVCVSHRENKAQYLIFSINKQIGHVLCVKIITNNLIL